MQEKHFHKLEREIRAMVVMNGPFIAELYGYYIDEESINLVMEYCEGGDLFKAMLLHGGKLDEHYVCVEVRTMPATLSPCPITATTAQLQMGLETAIVHIGLCATTNLMARQYMSLMCACLPGLCRSLPRCCVSLRSCTR